MSKIPYLIINKLSDKLFQDSNIKDLSLVKQYKWGSNSSNSTTTGDTSIKTQSQGIEPGQGPGSTETELIKISSITDISSKDRKILMKFKRRSYQLDHLINIYGFEIGLNNLFALIPIIGFCMSLINSILVYLLVFKLDTKLPILCHLTMLTNIMIEFSINFIPIIGQLFNANFKANSKNSQLLTKTLLELSEANMTHLMNYVNYDNKNNANNVLFSGSTTSHDHQDTDDHDDSDDLGVESDDMTLIPEHNLTETDPFFPGSTNSSTASGKANAKNSLQDNLVKKRRTLSNNSNHLYSSDSRSTLIR